MMNWRVRFTAAAREDLRRLLDFLLDRAETVEELGGAQDIIKGLRTAVEHQLAVTPYSFRKVGASSTRRELIVPAGATGYVALYEIENANSIVVLAVRHQREEDYH